MSHRAPVQLIVPMCGDKTQHNYRPSYVTTQFIPEDDPATHKPQCLRLVAGASSHRYSYRTLDARTSLGLFALGRATDCASCLLYRTLTPSTNLKLAQEMICNASPQIGTIQQDRVWNTNDNVERLSSLARVKRWQCSPEFDLVHPEGFAH